MNSYELFKGTVSRDIWRTFNNGLIGLGQERPGEGKKNIRMNQMGGGGGHPDNLAGNHLLQDYIRQFTLNSGGSCKRRTYRTFWSC